MSAEMLLIASLSALSVVQQTGALPLFFKRAADIGNFGSCSVPQIQFAVGFDNRKETSFEPVNEKSYPHSSADNIDIITQFMCDTLVNTCAADATAKATCATAKAAADTKTTKTGAQADAFNAVFGIKTNFAAVAEVNDQGVIVAAGSGAVAAKATTAAPPVASSVAADANSATSAASSTTSTANSVASAPSSTASTASSTADFGSCTTPQIEFADGLNGRKETSFEPVDLTSFNHGSADNIDIITQFICDTLTNKCGANQAAKDLCATATTAVDAATAKTGAQADAFNAVFGIKTNFAAVTEVNDQGVVVAAGSGATAAASTLVSPAASSVASLVCSAVAAVAAAAATPAASGANLQTFTGALGGVTAPAVTSLANGQFQVDGNLAFNDKQSAITRSCDVQNNQCADAANAAGNQGALTVAACSAQEATCSAL